MITWTHRSVWEDTDISGVSLTLFFSSTSWMRFICHLSTSACRSARLASCSCFSSLCSVFLLLILALFLLISSTFLVTRLTQSGSFRSARRSWMLLFSSAAFERLSVQTPSSSKWSFSIWHTRFNSDSILTVPYSFSLNWEMEGLGSGCFGSMDWFLLLSKKLRSHCSSLSLCAESSSEAVIFCWSSSQGLFRDWLLNG